MPCENRSIQVQSRRPGEPETRCDRHIVVDSSLLTGLPPSNKTTMITSVLQKHRHPPPPSSTVLHIAPIWVGGALEIQVVTS